MSPVFPGCHTLFCPPAGFIVRADDSLRTAVVEAAWHSPHSWSGSITHTRQREDQPLHLTPGLTKSPDFNHAARATGAKWLLLLAVCSASRFRPGPRLRRQIPFHRPVEAVSRPKGCPFMSGPDRGRSGLPLRTFHHLPATTRGRLSN